MDFSKPVDSGKNSIDISIENITSTMRLSDDIPHPNGGILIISDGVMHMLPAAYSDGNDTTTYPKNKVWNFDLESREWDVQDSGFEVQVQSAAVAFDAEKEVGWYYGGNVMLNPSNKLGKM